MKHQPNSLGQLWSPRSVSRRTFLRGMGAAGLALPFIRQRGTALGQNGQFPTRLIVCYTANGVERQGESLWDCTGSENDFSLSNRLSPLDTVKSKLLTFSGLDNTSHPGGELGHEPCIIAALTGKTRVGTPNYKSDGESIDQLVANSLDGARFRNLALTVRGRTKSGFYTANGNRLQVEQNPATAFARVFQDFMPPMQDSNGGDEEAAMRLAKSNAQRRGVLDFVKDQSKRLSSELCGQEREMLDAHTATIERAYSNIQDFDPMEPAGHPMTCGLPNLGNISVDDHNRTPELARAQVNLITAAVACQMTPVVSFSLLGDYERENYPFLGLDGHAHHDFAHGPAASQSGAYQKINDFYFGIYADLVKRLDEIPEGDGTVLDNCLVVYVSDMRHAGHSQKNLPVVWAGSAGKQLRTGRFLQYGGRNHADHLLSIAQLMGVSADRFGTSSSPLPNLT